MAQEIKFCRTAGCRSLPIYGSSFCWHHHEDKDGWKDQLEESIRAGTNFKNENFLEADLSELNLSEMVALACNFTACRFSNTSLTKTVLRGSRFIRATFEGCNLEDSDFQFSELDGAMMFRVAGTNADFFLSTARHSSMLFCNFKDARFVDSDWTAVRFVNNDLTGVDARNWFSSMSLFSKIDISEANFEFANLGGSKLSAIRAKNTNLQRANILGIHAIDCDFREASFYYCRAAGSRFERCDFNDANLDRAVLRTSTFIKSDLSNTSQTNTVWDRARTIKE